MEPEISPEGASWRLNIRLVTKARCRMSVDAVQLDRWQLQFHELMASILRASAMIKREAGILGIAPRLWQAGRDLKGIRQLQQNIYESALELPDGAINDAVFKSLTESTGNLVHSIEELLDIARRKGLLNRSLTAGSLEVIRQRGGELAEYLDILRLSVDPELAAQISEGRSEFVEGRGVPLDSLLQ